MPLMSNRVMAALMSRASAIPALAKAAISTLTTTPLVGPRVARHNLMSLKRSPPFNGRCRLSGRFGIQSGVKKYMRHARRFGGPEVDVSENPHRHASATR